MENPLAWPNYFHRVSTNALAQAVNVVEESFLNPAAADCAAPREAIHSNLSLPSKIRLVLPPLAYLSRKLEQSPISKAKPRQELYLLEPEQ